MDISDYSQAMQSGCKAITSVIAVQGFVWLVVL